MDDGSAQLRNEKKNFFHRRQNVWSTPENLATHNRRKLFLNFAAKSRLEELIAVQFLISDKKEIHSSFKIRERSEQNNTKI